MTIIFILLPQVSPTRLYPNGRWTNNTAKTKDAWVEQYCTDQIALRIALERNKTLHNLGRNEYGDKGDIVQRFYKNKDCQNAFKNYFCWINFPRCDMDTDQSLPTCRSACRNFFKSCQYVKDLWRCGLTKYFNGYAPEEPTGNRTYMRDYFPGQPFRENKFDKNNKPVPICTPSIDGSASSLRETVYYFLPLALVAVTYLLN